jgi:hypothetical protein
MFCPIYKKGDKTEYKSYREFLCWAQHLLF